jgi:hypothetical protein
VSKSRISLEPSELNAAEDDWTEATLTIEREDEPDEDFRYQDITMTKAEMAAVYERMKLKYEQGIWCMGTIER